MTNFDWMNTLTEQELTNLAEHATHLLIERDKLTAKGYIETIRDYCLAIDKLHTDIPALPPYAKWSDLVYAFEELLMCYFSYNKKLKKEGR